MFNLMEYCARAVVRHLNGDMDLFRTYTRKAMKIYEAEKNMATVGELVSARTREKLYEMVN